MDWLALVKGASPFLRSREPPSQVAPVSLCPAHTTEVVTHPTRPDRGASVGRTGLRSRSADNKSCIAIRDSTILVSRCTAWPCAPSVCPDALASVRTLGLALSLCRDSCVLKTGRQLTLTLCPKTGVRCSCGERRALSFTVRAGERQKSAPLAATVGPTSTVS